MIASTTFLWLIAAMADRTPQDQDKYVLRFPDGMRDRLKASAQDNKRSLNAEIVARLEASYITEDLVLHDEHEGEGLEPRDHATRLAATFMQKLSIGVLSRDFKDPDDLKIFIADLLFEYGLPLEHPSSEGDLLLKLKRPLLLKLEAEAEEKDQEIQDEIVSRLEHSFEAAEEAFDKARLEEVVEKLTAYFEQTNRRLDRLIERADRRSGADNG